MRQKQLEVVGITIIIKNNSLNKFKKYSINMRSDKKYISPFVAFLLLLLVAFYLSYQIGKDAAHRDARIKAASEVNQQK